MLCPFLRDECQKDCTFRRSPISMPSTQSTTVCLIAAKLESINDNQCDQISKIMQHLGIPKEE